MTIDEALDIINTTPVLHSLLYDIGMLPEQCDNGIEYERMMAYAYAYQAGLDSAKVEI